MTVTPEQRAEWREWANRYPTERWADASVLLDLLDGLEQAEAERDQLYEAMMQIRDISIQWGLE